MHGDELVKALLALTKSEDERVRLGAIQTALDRGWGRPTQAIEAEISVYDRLSLAEQQALLAAIEALDPDPVIEAPAVALLGKLTGNGGTDF